MAGGILVWTMLWPPSVVDEFEDLGVEEFQWPEQPDEKTGVALVIHPKTQTIQVGALPRFSFTFENRGKNEVTLVEPGDGSAGRKFSWRTPVREWSRRWPDDGSRDCGNINVLKAEEVFTIAPGKSYVSKAEWFGWPRLSGPGRYNVSLRYANEPDRKWGGIPLGEHDPEAMARVRRSTPVVIVSSQVEIIVAR